MTTQTKEEAMTLFEQYRREWLHAARAFARGLGKAGVVVTINDVRKFGPPIPEGVDPRVAGAVFLRSEWERLGYTSSARRVSHGRPVAKFRLIGA